MTDTNILTFQKPALVKPDGTLPPGGNWLAKLGQGAVFYCRPNSEKGPGVMQFHIAVKHEKVTRLFVPMQDDFVSVDTARFSDSHELVEVIIQEQATPEPTEEVGEAPVQQRVDYTSSTENKEKRTNMGIVIGPIDLASWNTMSELRRSAKDYYDEARRNPEEVARLRRSGDKTTGVYKYILGEYLTSEAS